MGLGRLSAGLQLDHVHLSTRDWYQIRMCRTRYETPSLLLHQA